ncbi:hypothetical protein AB1L30_05400 [Bremerella sp. JC817]|uniref:hypothetical protein n=1 Tax=Bremerella sp. JC817 TaxID=3231756 RepID=UPI003458F08D
MIRSFFKRLRSATSGRWMGVTDLSRIATFLFCCTLIAAYVTFFVASSLIWAFAAQMSGMLLGFLFGIPKVQQGASPEDGRYQQQVNTNLEQVSDWVTKIIVGISLVQLQQIPGLFQSLVEYIALDSNISLGTIGAILVMFSVLGFFTGYLLTRVFLAPAFREADLAAIQFQQEMEELQSVTETPTNEITTLSVDLARSPRDAILDAWLDVVDALKLKLKENDKPYTAEYRLEHTALSNGLINQKQFLTIQSMRKIRNTAVHSPDLSIPDEDVRKFVNEATTLTTQLK